MRIVAFALTLVLLAACGGGGDEVVTSDDPRPSQTSSTPPTSGDPEPTTTTSSPPPPAEPAATEQRYTATATVLEQGDGGPQLCLGGIATSYPPQCGGPAIIGWSWDAVEGEESANGTTWGHYTVVGTWDGSALTLTEPPSVPDAPDAPPPHDDRFLSPCPTPEGGWQVVDEATATDAAMQEAMAYARAQPDVGGVWLDQSINPATYEEPIDEERMNDPRRLVLNVSFTGDLARHEAELRRRWGGPLCVSEAPAAMAELEAIRTEVQQEAGDRFVYSSIDEVRSRVELGVIVDDGLQERLDERYGEGVVVVDAMLRPVEG